jgi:tRNA-splicing ligase RtcB
MELITESPDRIRIEPHGAMRVPGMVFASEALLPDAADRALEQIANVATLPGIVSAAYAMPDIHSGYGFPTGGVAATDVAAGGVISPGGVGFDIACGVRLLASDQTATKLAPRLAALLDELDTRIPRGMGQGSVWELPRGRPELDQVLAGGARYVVERGHGTSRDLQRCEGSGTVAGADPAQVGARAGARGLGQLGSLGSGSHFLEVQTVAELYDQPTAAAFGLHAGQVCVMIHTGSRGLGHQVCTDHVRAMEPAMARYGITVPDRQLASVPVDSPPGRAYLGAMAAAANFALANRQVLGQAARRAFTAVAGAELAMVYDVSHNLARLEEHRAAGSEPRQLCVHRKGATRALPPGHPELPADLRRAGAGQPVLVPGSMGTASYVLAGVAGGPAFGSACHGAGRSRSRDRTAQQLPGRQLAALLARQGIVVRGLSWRGLAEQAPAAYKDVAEVVAVAQRVGLGRVVARLVPLAVVKG